MSSPQWSIESESLGLSGSDPASWETIAAIQSLGFPPRHSQALPDAPYVCTDCGRDFMRDYPACPMCDAEGSIKPVKPVTPPEHTETPPARG